MFGITITGSYARALGAEDGGAFGRSWRRGGATSDRQYISAPVSTTTDLSSALLLLSVLEIYLLWDPYTLLFLTLQVAIALISV